MEKIMKKNNNLITCIAELVIGVLLLIRRI